MSESSQSKHLNRLSAETSPYLLQHRHNPVEWYSWGPEAFEAARRQNKPIFLSVGYSTCYWCHVMERESFENGQVAQEMNRRFISIKVDREERPEVDQIYMTAVQVLTRHGGWPMSVFLTPDLRPFYGGTYFPPTDQTGRPGFVTILRGIDDAWHNRPADVERTATELTGILQQLAEPSHPEKEMTLDLEWIDSLIGRSIGDYDPVEGGFGSAPKFPRPTLLELLLVYLRDPVEEGRQTSAEKEFRRTLRQRVFHTLDALAAGGIRDQLGGAFHRYSTDAQWRVPHFEIMLYDNALLAWCYVEAYRQTEDPRYARIARGIFDFVLREMTSPVGAFYTAFDAEVDAREGASYLWTQEQIEQALGPDDAAIFNHVYGVDQGPNFSDPHQGDGRPQASVLYLAVAPDKAAAQLNLDQADLESRLGRMRAKLLQIRNQRKQPSLDTKILTSWNGLMIRALAYGRGILGEQRYGDAAARAADYLLRRHRTGDGTVIRTSRPDLDSAERAGGGGEVYVAEPRQPEASARGVEPASTRMPENPVDSSHFQIEAERLKVSIPGLLDDYAFLVHGLLALRDGSGNDKWADHAAAVAIIMLDQFQDAEQGGFYFTPRDATDLIVRQKIASDNPLPSGNAVAAMAMLTLGHPAITAKTLSAFAAQLQANAEGMSSMVLTALAYHREKGALTVPAGAEVGGRDRPLTPEQTALGIASLRGQWIDPSRLEVHVNLLKGFHINAHQAAAALQPTRLVVTGEQAAHVQSIDYPPGTERRFAFTEQPLHIYDGEIVIAVRFARPARGGVHLALTYQPCDDSACLPVVTRQMDVEGP